MFWRLCSGGVLLHVICYGCVHFADTEEGFYSDEGEFKCNVCMTEWDLLLTIKVQCLSFLTCTLMLQSGHCFMREGIVILLLTHKLKTAGCKGREP